MLPTINRRPMGGLRRNDWLGGELDRMFDDFFTRPLSTWSTWTPAADLYETDDEFVLDLEMPGFSHDDIEVTVERGILTVSGQRTAEEEQGNRHTYHVRERSYDRFSRSFSLPHSVNADEVQARFENGILNVRLPKAAEAKPRRIAVSAE